MATLVALLASACGGSITPDQVAAEPAASDPTPAAAQVADSPTAASVKTGSTPLGEVLVGPEGLTLYGFTNDVNGVSACYDACADAWPPVIVNQDWNVSPGLDIGIFNTLQRDDGTLQLVAGKWPLYYFAGDAVPGDTAGQGSGDVWFVVSTDGALVTDDTTSDEASPADTSDTSDTSDDQAASGPLATTGTSSLGSILTTSDGLSLYGFTNDVDGVPSCNDACADAWPPVLVDGPTLPDGLDPSLFSVAERSDGTHQLVAGVWPLYRFAGDAVAGDINGQGSGGNWFLANPEGGLIKKDEAAETRATTEPVADEPSTGSGRGY